MGRGAVIVGGNGSGKTTLGRLLAEKLGWKRLDIEDFYFPFTASENPYAISRTRHEVQERLLAEVARQDRFVFSAVNGDMGAAVNRCYDWIIVLEAPMAIRLRRVKERSIRRFGSRAMPGGELYDQERRFWQMAENKTMDQTEQWIRTMNRPVLRLDGTRPAEENAALAERFIRSQQPTERA